MDKKTQTFRARAKSWANKNGLQGPQAFFRFVIFTYLDCLSKEGDEFIIKGGNLFWIYTQTPRHTIDLDLVTRKLDKTAELKRVLEKACYNAEGITFALKSIKETFLEEMAGAAVTLGYKTEDGASNKFELDIVYALPTKTIKLPSPIPGNGEIYAATLENIVTDKISACHRFGPGNTRMKDYDDLWRLAFKDRKVDLASVGSLLLSRGISLSVDPNWINDEMIFAWKRHIKRYKDLPTELNIVFKDINTWLGGKS